MLIEDLSEVAESQTPSPQPELAPLHLQVSPAANAAVIVAHPDDETLWAGGMILTHPDLRCAPCDFKSVISSKTGNFLGSPA